MELGYTDTDSFIYEIRTEDFEDIREDVPTIFDTSTYPEDHLSGLPRVNKKVPGLMKDEGAGRIITKAVCLGPKQYAYEIDEYDGMCEKEFCDGGCGKKGCIGSGGKKCKGVKKGVVKRQINMASVVAGGLFNAIAFAGAGYVFHNLDKSGYEAEVE